MDGFAQVDDVTDGADQGIFCRGHLTRAADIHPLRPDGDVNLRSVFQSGLVRHPERQPGAASGPFPTGVFRRCTLEEIGFADELGDERGPGILVDLGRRAQLSEPGISHHADPVGHGEGLFLIVGDIDEGGAQLLVQGLELQLHFLPELEIDCPERLVQQQDWPAPGPAPEPAPLAAAALRTAGSASVSRTGRDRAGPSPEPAAPVCWISALGVFRCSRPKATFLATER